LLHLLVCGEIARAVSGHTILQKLFPKSVVREILEEDDEDQRTRKTLRKLVDRVQTEPSPDNDDEPIPVAA
jgi:hypothetical protein